MTDETALRYGLAVLATWRVTHLLAAEDGPFGLIARARARLGHGPVGALFDCFYCLSLWIAAPVALFVSTRPIDWGVSVLALSGGACLLERLGEKPVVIEQAPQTHPKGYDDVLR